MVVTLHAQCWWTGRKVLRPSSSQGETPRTPPKLRDNHHWSLSTPPLLQAPVGSACTATSVQPSHEQHAPGGRLYKTGTGASARPADHPRPPPGHYNNTRTGQRPLRPSTPLAPACMDTPRTSPRTRARASDITSRSTARVDQTARPSRLRLLRRFRFPFRCRHNMTGHNTARYRRSGLGEHHGPLRAWQASWPRTPRS